MNDYGLTCKNDYGQFIIDGSHPVSSLAYEHSLGPGFHDLVVEKDGFPVIAVNEAWGMLHSVNIEGDFCHSARIYLQPFRDKGNVRVYVNPVPSKGFGVNVYNRHSDCVFTSLLPILNIEDTTTRAGNYRYISKYPAIDGFTQMETLPPGISESVGVYKLFYRSDIRVTGRWLVLNTLYGDVYSWYRYDIGTDKPRYQCEICRYRSMFGIQSNGQIDITSCNALKLSHGIVGNQSPSSFFNFRFGHSFICCS